MISINWMILIGFILAFVITLPLIFDQMMAQAQIITVPMPENNTKIILNMKDLTETFVNATTNETIKVGNFTLYRPNATTNETLTTNMGNATTNETLTTNMGNATTDNNLTAKFKELQGN